MESIEGEKNQQTFSDIPKIINPDTCEKNIGDKKSDAKKYFKRKKLTAIFTIVIGISTTIYTIFSILQWNEMKNSNEITRESLNLAEKTARIELSAYIQIDTIKVTQMEMGKTLNFSLVLFNSGKTPAYDVYASIGIKPGGNPNNINISEEEWLKLKEKPPIEGYFIGSHISITNPINTDILIKDNTTIPAWKNGSKFLGIYGYVFYKNIFSDSCNTQFFMFYDYRWDRFNYKIKDNYIHTTNNPN